MTTVYLDKNQVPAALRGSYQGNKFKAVVCESVTIPADAGLWSGGSRDTYTAIEFTTGKTVPVVEHNAAPWDGSRRDIPVTLKPGFAVVRHSMFCGTDMGLTFYVHPANATALLPAPSAELTEYEKIVLNATRSYKSSYAGKDRYDMARGDIDGTDFPTRQEWQRCKDSLIAKGLLNKAGAITTAGKNALPSRY